MANISDANGKLTLVGDWTQEAIDIFLPVLNAWGFYGGIGIQWCDELSEKKLSADFGGCGRWTFSSTLDSLDESTHQWIDSVAKGGNDHGCPLTTEQYDLLLKTMHENNLSINVEYDDVEEMNEHKVHETGTFISDGEELLFELTSSEEIIREWKDIVSIAAGSAFSFGVKSGGTVCVAGKYIRPDATLD